MDTALILVALVVAIALVFDYINGFHDAANSIATIVATRVLTPGQAVAFAAFFNFSAVLFSGTAVAQTMGNGLVDLTKIDNYVILSGLLGAITWNLITWYWGLPSSSSHALIGGYAGSAFAKAGFAALMWGPKWRDTLLFIFVAPLIGLGLAYILMIAVFWIFKGFTPKKMDSWFRRLQLVSSAFFSYAHGTNDAQKTMGIITGVLFTGGVIKKFEVPFWVELAAYSAIGLGTLSGGWRIIRTMGARLTRLKPRSGFCAETAAGMAIVFATLIGKPVSTTHTVAGAIAGVGSIQRVRAVRWGIAASIVWAWILTIPAAATVGFLCQKLIGFLVY
ncbi:MAG: inorganic phosphate transporter [Bryobacteraceae bacterium]